MAESDSWYREHDPALPALLLAPPGCGKTENLALWATSLVERSWLVPPAQTLALSYSKKASASLRERLRLRLGPRAHRYVDVRTFHSWAARLLRAHGPRVGVRLPESPPRQQQLNAVLKQAAKAAGEDEAAVRAVLRLVKSAGHPPEEIVERLAARSHAALAYQRALESLDVPYDYDDLVGQARRLLEVPEVAELYRLRFPAVIIDEVQDITLALLELATAHGPVSRVFAGDVTQGIYRFAGAEPVSVLHSIRETEPRELALTTSYRSAPAILDVVARFGEPLGAEPLTAADPERWEGCSSFEVRTHDDWRAEAGWIADAARGLLQLDHVATVGVMTRVGRRRKWIDAAVEARGLTAECWDDAVHSPEALALMRRRVSSVPIDSATPAEDLQAACLAVLDEEVDIDTAAAVHSACAALRDQAATTADLLALISRLRVDSEPDAPVGPGLHLLNGHLGKGQEFDAVIVAGLEESSLPFYWALKAERAGDGQAVLDELAVLRVMASRARHHLVISHALVVPNWFDEPEDLAPSRFLELL